MDIKKSYFFIGLGISLILVGSWFPLQAILPPWNQKGGSVILGPNVDEEFSLWFFKGCLVRGVINIYVDVGYDVYARFSVEDVQGHPFVNAKRVYDDYQFEYKIQRTGYYHFCLSDGSGEKTVFWNIKIYYYRLLFQIIGALCLLVGLFPLFLRLKNWLLK